MTVVMIVVRTDAPPCRSPTPTYCMEPAKIKRLMAAAHRTPYPALLRRMPKPMPKAM
jgi:hypothetical protein